MDHVFKDVAAGVIPVKPPVHVPLWIEGTMFCFPFKGAPIDMLLVTIRWNLAQPAAIGRVAVVMCFDGGYGTHPLGCSQFSDFPDSWSAVHLHPDLNDSSGILECSLHASGMVGIKRHGLLLIDVLAGLNRGNKIERMLVLGCGDEHCVNLFVVEQPLEVA